MRGSPSVPAEVRFWRFVRYDHGCLSWSGKRLRGYGHFWTGSKMVQAHRYAYETWIGALAPGLQVDHLCRNPSCVNPLHLEAVSLKENVLRGIGIGARNAAKTHCSAGHPLSGDNLRVNRFAAGRIGRACVACSRLASRRCRARAKANK